MDIELAQALEENGLLKSLLYCTKKSCNNCGKVNCENFQRQRKDCCENWVSYKDYIAELEQQIEKMKWHKVADGDIPKNERWVCNQDGCYCYYDIDTEQWLDTEGTRTKTIEWCDMPTKEIKEK